MSTAHKIQALSRWIDEHPANIARDPEANTWGRIAKIQEEAGEVISALIGATGQNPRKGTYATMGDVRKELLDVALAALAAIEHLDGNRGQALQELADHVAWTHRRAGLGEVA